jgi:hypothetical protein
MTRDVLNPFDIDALSQCVLLARSPTLLESNAWTVRRYGLIANVCPRYSRTLGLILVLTFRCMKGKAGNNGTCTPCIPGKFADRAGLASCISVGAGHYSPGIGSLISTRCQVMLKQTLTLRTFTYNMGT